MTSPDTIWETSEDGSVAITLKPKGGHEVPWIVLRYPSVSAALAAFKKDDGAELMELFKNVSGAQKAYDQTYNNREAPAAKTQGKPEGANTPSPQVEMKADPFKQEDDAPPFGDSEPEVPSCKHGKMKLVEHSGKKGYVCASGLPKENPERCASIML
jgi:hypothetical protein